MLENIYRKIKEYNTIVIARHIGVDPDALGSQLSLKLSIQNTFKDKKVYAVGMKSSRYNYFPRLDKFTNSNKDALLIVVDTPDKKRIDIDDLDSYAEICKIDHHPFIEKFGDNEYIDTEASSASELVLKFIQDNKMYIDEEVAKYIFLGIVSDTNRFLFNTTYKTFQIVSCLVKDYRLDVEKLYQSLFMRPLSEIRFQGYISLNMKVTNNHLAYIILDNNIMKEYGVDASSAGNMINNFNSIEEVLVWVTVSEDVKNNIIKFNIRSRGPVVNTVAEKYHGGGHKFACGVRLNKMDDVMNVINDLDDVCKDYIEKEGII